MPVMNGMDSARAMRSLERERGQKPATIIALTGLATATAHLEAYSSGINTFLVKPIRFDELRRILKNWTPEEAPPRELGSQFSETGQA
jgi:CheY-like chemotaxis protein